MDYTGLAMRKTPSPVPKSRKSDARALAHAAHEMQPHSRQAADVLRALANEQRLMILCHLLPAPLSVGQLNERVPLSQSALSQHLAVLRNARMVRTERQSQTVYYSLAPGIVTRLLGVLHEEFCGL